MEVNKKKILFLDLEGTLIRSCAGKSVFSDVTDFRIRKDVLDKIKGMHGLRYVFIISNQDCVPSRYSEHDFRAMLASVCTFVRNYINDIPNSVDDIDIEAYYCTSSDDDNPNRKPNTGLLERAYEQGGLLEFSSPFFRNKSKMLFVGDESGKHGSGSERDKRCAYNFGVDYMDVEDFVQLV